MGAHVFLVGQDNFAVCLERGVYGSVSHPQKRITAEVIAGALSVKPGDLIFFHVNNVGLFGLWKATTDPFFDETPIWQHPSQRFPYRFCFEPIVYDFSDPISFMDVLDLKDRGKLWAYDLGAKVQKNHYAITSSEARELIRLLLRNNPIRKPIKVARSPYRPKVLTPIAFDLEADSAERLRFEGLLNAALTQQFVRGEFKNIFGDYQDVLNFVPTTFNKVMDLFLTHVTQVNGVDILHKFTCVELKTDRASEEDLAQLLRYETWLVRRLADGENGMVQSALIAHSFSDGVLKYITAKRSIEERTVRLFRYAVDKAARRIDLHEVL